jgi:hypothetical protein
MMNLYTSFSWPTLCAEVAKLKISLPERRAPPWCPHAAKLSQCDKPPRESAGSTHLEKPTRRRRFCSGLLPDATPNDTRPMERGHADPPVPVETNGAPKSFGEVAVATAASCSATCSAEPPMIASRWPGLNGRPTVYEGKFPHGNQANFHDVSATGKREEVDPHPRTWERAGPTPPLRARGARLARFRCARVRASSRPSAAAWRSPCS